VIASPKALDWGRFLGRRTLLPPPPELVNGIVRQPILIAGAGGSIGSQLALRLANFAVPSLVLLESCENSLYHLEREWSELQETRSAKGAYATFMLGDASDRALLDEIFNFYQPRLIIHAAAHKHVPLLEDQPFAAIANNIFATETVTAAAAAHGARVVLLSTDKAVEPGSVMGAAKRIAEEIVLTSGGTVLRLGNVLASSGSVTEVFAEQITRGGPLTVTDAAARRYFLTLDDAVNLLLRAAVHRDSSAVLAPNLAATHRVVELAEFMARSLAPGRDLPICFTGLRPGDKVSESFWEDSDGVTAAGGDLVCIQASRPAPELFQSGLATLRNSLRERDLCAALAQLKALVPNYCPNNAVLALAEKRRVCV
jgi:FlaA1/EpsC-like NDP-sugar epimerase